ncbi:tRNA (N(6)-L-threonylcarbamoyladenosine(37)-C(2))-methylthiotransferase MtaB [Treponema zuelzerae]|uniref:tRNA (N(6)-L-threonylcarbamoyladenosine(37)-C(2))-methylthiotransferase MtaB n=1 Tax=Teretinema zuelzerae TaxID=156 RepID=A0AAE3JK01_9SPIR|nr:tRNA (N(6)-L-threonylcarbamoyladenosine(37)-C(2))-methylthiotransferase MtaB [Teretinema zuelzerae]MCD1653504.1 tRNA (N(6)-L-threonylcarbamoyladenosine(37)-C(2))-methylthiotransferase MtaB [Teretinema zuelzerae]
MDIVHFETLGCKLNQIETESLAHAFKEAGFRVTLSHETAETAFKPIEPILLSVVNTCTVTGKAEQKARRLIRLLLKNHPEAAVLVTGCYAEVEADALAEIDPRVVVIPGTRKGELAELPACLAAELVVHPELSVPNAVRRFFLKPAEGPESSFKLSTDAFLLHSRASIKIQDGCANRCSYCRIRLARGKSVSLAADEAVARVIAIEEAGWGEVVLTGVNLSQYKSGGEDFARLLERILANTKRITVRISSLYPERVDEGLLPILKDPRVRPHFHLSVQSGSDRILSLMRRPYMAETVYRAAEGLRSVKKDPFLACDIIAGFPGETEEDFALTEKLCRDIGFSWIHAFPFSARPGTEAWSMKPKIPERIAGERVAILTAMAEQNREKYIQRWMGEKLDAIVEGSERDSKLSVLTENYISAPLASASAEKGQRITIVLRPGPIAEPAD